MNASTFSLVGIKQVSSQPLNVLLASLYTTLYPLFHVYLTFCMPNCLIFLVGLIWLTIVEKRDKRFYLQIRLFLFNIIASKPSLTLIGRCILRFKWIRPETIPSVSSIQLQAGNVGLNWGILLLYITSMLWAGVLKRWWLVLKLDVKST